MHKWLSVSITTWKQFHMPCRLCLQGGEIVVDIVDEARNRRGKNRRDGCAQLAQSVLYRLARVIECTLSGCLSREKWILWLICENTMLKKGSGIRYFGSCSALLYCLRAIQFVSWSMNMYRCVTWIGIKCDQGHYMGWCFAMSTRFVCCVKNNGGDNLKKCFVWYRKLVNWSLVQIFDFIAWCK